VEAEGVEGVVSGAFGPLASWPPGEGEAEGGFGLALQLFLLTGVELQLHPPPQPVLLHQVVEHKFARRLLPAAQQPDQAWTVVEQLHPHPHQAFEHRRSQQPGALSTYPPPAITPQLPEALLGADLSLWLLISEDGDELAEEGLDGELLAFEAVADVVGPDVLVVVVDDGLGVEVGLAVVEHADGAEQVLHGLGHVLQRDLLPPVHRHCHLRVHAPHSLAEPPHLQDPPHQRLPKALHAPLSHNLVEHSHTPLQQQVVVAEHLLHCQIHQVLPAKLHPRGVVLPGRDGGSQLEEDLLVVLGAGLIEAFEVVEVVLQLVRLRTVVVS
jgi:hypothetical protein